VERVQQKLPVAANKHLRSDKRKLCRFAMHLYFAGEVKRQVFSNYKYLRGGSDAKNI
jgi:hypothetical protein